jgi:1-acyl-sn-glycerol-3-phosphate acyltransferase
MIMAIIRSIWVWVAVSVLVIVWLPLMALWWLLDRDPVKYRTGRMFRRLGVAMTMVNPSWRIHVDGHRVENPRNPYVVVSNHQSMADIPIVSHLPWEMKWIGKETLFKIPLIGWMMKFSGDIPVDRSDRRSGARMLLTAIRYLDRKCSVIFFPEGTRSPDGRLGRFNEGAFQLAIKAGVPILPVVLDGSSDCLPKKSWKFGPPLDIHVRVLPPVPTDGMTSADGERLTREVRNRIAQELASWRGVSVDQVDALASEK